MMRLWGIHIILFLVFFGTSFSSFSQGNYRIENYGNLSILLSGNVTGSVSDLGLTYYNPARLPFVDGNVFTLSAKSYQLNNVTLNDVFQDQKKISNSNFEGIPSMIAGTFTVKNWDKSKFAYSFISRRNTDLNFEYNTGLSFGDILEGFPGEELYEAGVELASSEKDDWFGITWAKQYSDNFSIGVSTFVSVYKGTGNSETKYIANHSDDLVASYFNDIGYEQSSYGIFWKIGLAWKLEKLDLGVNIGLPYVEVQSGGKMHYEDYLAGLGSGKDIFTYNRFENIESQRKEPISLAIGAGIPVGKNRIHLSVEGYGKVDKYTRLEIPTIDSVTGEPFDLSFNEQLKAIVNFGIGAELYFSPKVNGFISYSSDFSAYEENANIFDLINERSDLKVEDFLNYNHFGLGVDMKLKWAKVVLGATYSKGNQTIVNPLELPNPGPDPIARVAGMSVSRWRIILGADIPLLSKKLEAVTGDDDKF